MTPTPRRGRLTRAQLEIMNVVWDLGQVTVADVLNALAKQRQVARTTVLTMMRRLEDKGWLRHETKGNYFVYYPTISRKKTAREMVLTLVDTAFAGSAEGLIMALLDARGLSRKESRRIRSLIDKANRETTA